jgi:uncharacterized membrane protein
MSMLLYGLLTGFLFGLLLQKGRVIRYDKQIGALRFMDMTIVKFMLSAIVAGMVGIYLLRDLGVVKLTFKPTLIWANVLGGLAFGAGWGLLGYCPGTAIGALGEGRWDALWGILGMLAGAALFAEAYPSLIKTFLFRGNLGYMTLPGAFGVNHWFIIPVFAVGCIVLFRWFEKKGL